MNLLNKKDIDNNKIINNTDINNTLPFFENYYNLIVVNEVNDVILITAEDLIKDYIGDDINSMIIEIDSEKEIIKSYVYKIHQNIYLLKNGYYCLYIEKNYIWDGFLSTGVILVLTYKKEKLHLYCNTL